MSQLTELLSTTAWAGGFALAGIAVGVGCEHFVYPALKKAMPHMPAVRAVLQGALSLFILGETMQLVVPPATVAPVGDGIMMYFLFTFQPSLMGDVAWVVSSLLSQSVASVAWGAHNPVPQKISPAPANKDDRIVSGAAKAAAASAAAVADRVEADVFAGMGGSAAEWNPASLMKFH